ncbi:hypothetical protein VTO42DRAFT_6194 [Malbranchea cinnamomea]
MDPTKPHQDISLLLQQIQEFQQRTEAAEQRAQTAEQRAEAERHRAQTAEQHIEAERQRAEAERQRAEAERHRAQTAEQHAAAERQRAEAERQRAEAERHRAQTAEQHIEAERQRAEAERHRAQTAEQRLQGLTFAEFLEACHHHISKPLRVETKPEYTTKGSITSPNGRICPTFLEPWDFRATQQSLFDEVYRIFQCSPSSPARVFPSLPVIEDRGHKACGKALASEADLVRHQMFEVEFPVEEVIERLIQIPEAHEKFNLGEGIAFHNHTAGIMEEPEQPHPPLDGALQPRADQNCVYMRAGGQRRLLYIIEYKAAHKLTDAYLRAGLRRMNMWEQVVQRLTIPTDSTEKLQYNAERLSCAAVTQAYEYMMKAGLEFGTLTNGSSKVMLRIPEDDPATLQYCHLEPRRDAEPDENGFRYPYTALGCHVGLTLLALQQPQRPQQWRNTNIQKLNRWEVDFDALVRKIPDEERTESPPASEYRRPYYPINPRSPYILRNRNRRIRLTCSNPEKDHPAVDSSSGSDSDTVSHEPPSSPIQSREKRRKTDGQRPLPPAYPLERPPRTEYCTQKCLLGLSKRSSFDDACPNVEVHRRCSADQRHPIDRSEFTKLMQRQLNQDPDHGCRPLVGKEGLHGALFKLTLDPYGYTFVGKGTTYKSDYEGRIYQHLKELQGSAVPVYLGDIYLTEMIYYLRPDYEVIHMCLMAWGGEDLGDGVHNRAEQIARTRDEIYAAGVVHLDERDLNMLWNPEVQRVQFVDFGRAKIICPRNLKRKSSVLREIDSNQEKREREKREKICC